MTRTASPAQSTTVSRRTPRRWLVLFAALLAVVAVAFLAGRFLLQPSVGDIQGQVLAASGSTRPALAFERSEGKLQTGQVLVVRAQTEHADQVRVVLRDGETGAALATVPEVDVAKDGAFEVTLNATSDLEPGRFTVQLYLDGSDTVSGSLGFEVTS